MLRVIILLLCFVSSSKLSGELYLEFSSADDGGSSDYLSNVERRQIDGGRLASGYSGNGKEGYSESEEDSSTQEDTGNFLYDIEEKMKAAGKWEEFKEEATKQKELHKGEVMKDWEQDAKKWEKWTHKLYKEGMKEKALRTQQKVRQKFGETPYIHKNPSPGLGMYWADAEDDIKSATPRPLPSSSNIKKELSAQEFMKMAMDKLKSLNKDQPPPGPVTPADKTPKVPEPRNTQQQSHRQLQQYSQQGQQYPKQGQQYSLPDQQYSPEGLQYSQQVQQYGPQSQQYDQQNEQYNQQGQQYSQQGQQYSQQSQQYPQQDQQYGQQHHQYLQQSQQYSHNDQDYGHQSQQYPQGEQYGQQGQQYMQQNQQYQEYGQIGQQYSPQDHVYSEQVQQYTQQKQQYPQQSQDYISPEEQSLREQQYYHHRQYLQQKWQLQQQQLQSQQQQIANKQKQGQSRDVRGYIPNGSYGNNYYQEQQSDQQNQLLQQQNYQQQQQNKQRQPSTTETTTLMPPKWEKEQKQIELLREKARQMIASKNMLPPLKVTNQLRSVTAEQEYKPPKIDADIVKFPLVDDFNAPIRWVDYSSNDTADGLAKVTDPLTGTNRQYIVNGSILVPVIDYSLERLGFTMAPQSTTRSSIPRPPETMIKTVLRNIEPEKADERDWLVMESILGGRNDDDKCRGENCQARCHEVGCESKCIGESCASGCVGDNCNAYCKGPGCFAMCIGEDCTSKCDGQACDSRCRGKGCRSTCSSFNCYQTSNGKFSMGGRNWEDHYPQYEGGKIPAPPEGFYQ